jgi:hypothetical protein
LAAGANAPPNAPRTGRAKHRADNSGGESEWRQRTKPLTPFGQTRYFKDPADRLLFREIYGKKSIKTQMQAIRIRAPVEDFSLSQTRH